MKMIFKILSKTLIFTFKKYSNISRLYFLSCMVGGNEEKVHLLLSRDYNFKISIKMKWAAARLSLQSRLWVAAIGLLSLLWQLGCIVIATSALCAIISVWAKLTICNQYSISCKPHFEPERQPSEREVNSLLFFYDCVLGQTLALVATERFC